MNSFLSLEWGAFTPVKKLGECCCHWKFQVSEFFEIVSITNKKSCYFWWFHTLVLFDFQFWMSIFNLNYYFFISTSNVVIFLRRFVNFLCGLSKILKFWYEFFHYLAKFSKNFQPDYNYLKFCTLVHLSLKISIPRNKFIFW